MSTAMAAASPHSSPDPATPDANPADAQWADDKPALRRQARAARAAAFARDGEAAAHALSRRVLEAGLVPAGATVGGYWPLGSELDCRPLLLALVDAGCWCALPVVTGAGQPLRFRLWRPGDDLVPGPHGCREPAEGAPEILPEVLLVPLLAFDSAGHRLGQGGGFYDRTLAAIRGSGDAVPAIGLAFAAQERPALPVGPRDQRLDRVATEVKIWDFSE